MFIDLPSHGRADVRTEGKVASAEVAAKVDEDPPLDQLMRLANEKKKDVGKGESVVYWMRMEDIRSAYPLTSCGT